MLLLLLLSWCPSSVDLTRAVLRGGGGTPRGVGAAPGRGAVVPAAGGGAGGLGGVAAAARGGAEGGKERCVWHENDRMIDSSSTF